VEHDDFKQDEFWRAIMGRRERYNSNTSKVTFIRNPVIAHMDRILSNTLCTRSKGSCILRKELYVLWCMLYGVRFNVAAYFFNQLHKFTTHGFQLVNIEGLITLIVEYYRVNLSGHRPIRGDSDLILTSCVRMGLIERLDDTCMFIREKNPSTFRFLLVIVDLTTIRVNNNY